MSTAHHVGGREKTATSGPCGLFRHVRARTADVGATGFVATAVVLDWIHEAAQAVATEWSGRRCVTKAVGNIAFDGKIRAGDAVTTHACLIYTHDDTMDVLVTVCVAAAQIAQCSIIFGAVDEAGEAVAVESWRPDTMLQLQRRRQARSRERMRTLIEDAVARASEPGVGAAPSRRLSRAVGPAGQICGGHLASWIDQACNAVGADWAGAELLTAYVAGVRFSRAAFEGPTAVVTARLIHTGARSLHVSARVDDVAERSPIACAVLVLEAPDDLGRPRPVRQWVARCDADRGRQDHARRLVELRQFVEPFSSWPTADGDNLWIVPGNTARETE